MGELISIPKVAIDYRLSMAIKLGDGLIIYIRRHLTIVRTASFSQPFSRLERYAHAAIPNWAKWELERLRACLLEIFCSCCKIERVERLC